MKRFPVLYLIAGTILALIISLTVVIVGLQPSQHDLRLLIQFMLVSGLSTILVVYFLYEHLLAKWMNSLRWSMLVTVFTTVTLVFVNVWATAQLMFINNHDLILTTALLIFGGLTAIVFGWFIANRIASKIQVVSNAIEQMADGDLSVHIEVTGSDEISTLAKMLNWTVDSLKEIEEEKKRTEALRRDLIAWISHDLRTPLTAVQASLEAIADDVVSEPEDVKDYIHNSLGELGNLRVLIDDLFSIAQIDAGHMSLKFTEASLSDLISDTVSSLSPHAQRRKLTIHGEIQADMPPVYMAPDKIQRVLYNLIDNAIRHTPEGGNITIGAKKSAESVQVEVHNTGEMIPPEHLPHIFEKFYRGEQARQRDSDGHRGAGLGLAIAQGFIEAHQGKIQVESNDKNGTCFSFTIPISHSDSESGMIQ